MKLHHSPEHVVSDGPVDDRRYGKFAIVDSAIEVYDEWHNNMATVVYDPALKYGLALSILEDGEELEAPANDWGYTSPNQAALNYSTEELEYLVWGYLKALQIKQQDELEQRREQKKLHDLGQKLRSVYVDGTLGDNRNNVWLEIAKTAEKELSA